MADTRARGTDVSQHQRQSELRLDSWRAEPGLSFGWYRASIGTLTDTAQAAHGAALRAAGYLTGAYHAIHEVADPRVQARLFWSLQHAGNRLPPVLDVERARLTRAMVESFVEEWATLGGPPLCIYTSAQSWHAIMGRGAIAWAAALPLWVAAYPYDTRAGRPVPMDPVSVALRSTPPTDSDPPLPDPWARWDIWQHSGQGSLPGFGKFIDLNVYNGAGDELAARWGEATEQPTMTGNLKLGPHHLIGGHDTAAWLGLQPTVAKAVGDLGVLQQAAPGTLRVGRMADDGQLPGGGFDANRYASQIDPAAMAAVYTDWLTRYIDSNPWVDVWEGPNEQVIENSDNMAWYSHFLYEFAKRIKAKGKRAGLGGWAVGNPRRELNLWPHYVWALQACRDQSAILTRHEYGPLDGYNSLRYRYDNAEFTRLGYPNLPVIISECGADDAGGMTRWRTYYKGDIGRYWRDLLRPYADAMASDSYCLGGTVFCVGGGTAWNGFDVDGTGLVDLLRAYTPANGDDDMDKAKIEAQVLIIERAAAAIRNLLDDVPAPLFRVKILVEALNVRSGPAVSFADVGDVLKDAIVPVYAVSTATGWYRIDPTVDKWISGGTQYSVRV